MEESVIRMGVFVLVLLGMAMLEYRWPRKARQQPQVSRWITNLSIVVIDTIAVRVFVPITALFVAEFVASNQWGLFGVLNLPAWLEFVLAFVLLDMCLYWQHVLFHRIPILWKVHKVHHVDRDFDVTTGVRFHPIEIVLSVLYKFLFIFVIGPAAVVVFVFEVALNASSLFNHANYKLPLGFDRWLRWIVVTPDMHRVHHSVYLNETNSNYGFNLSIWDRVFSSYVDQPKDGHTDMQIGLQEVRSDKPSELMWSLSLPFRSFKKPEKSDPENQ